MKTKQFLFVRVLVVAAYLVVASGTASAAIIVDSVSAPASTNSLTESLTVGNGDNRYLVVAVVYDQNGTAQSVTGVTYGGAAMTQASGSVATGVNGTRTTFTDLWYLINPASGTADFTATLSGAVDDFNVGAISFENVAQQAPEATANSSPIGNASVIATSITTLTDGAMVVDVVGFGADENYTFTSSPGDIMERWDVSNTTDFSSAGGTRLVSTAGLVTNTWTPSGGSNRLPHSLLALAPVVTASTPEPSTFLLSLVGMVGFAVRRRRRNRG